MPDVPDHPSPQTRSTVAARITAHVTQGWPHRARARWYTTKTEPSYDDMTVKLRRVIIAARFCSPRPEQVTPQETRAVLAAWAAAETRSTKLRNTSAQSA